MCLPLCLLSEVRCDRKRYGYTQSDPPTEKAREAQLAPHPHCAPSSPFLRFCLLWPFSGDLPVCCSFLGSPGL